MLFPAFFPVAVSTQKPCQWWSVQLGGETALTLAVDTTLGKSDKTLKETVSENFPSNAMQRYSSVVFAIRSITFVLIQGDDLGLLDTRYSAIFANRMSVLSGRLAGSFFYRHSFFALMTS